MSTLWNAIKKLGSGWLFNEADYTYNQSIDENTGAIIYYNSAGTETVWTAINKP